ncbi:hypothetical protein QJQ45_014548, partial [Haematococcus lacustris]
MDDAHLKRKFPYHSQVSSFALKRQGLGIGSNAGTEAAQPRVFEQPNYEIDNYGERRVRSASCIEVMRWQLQRYTTIVRRPTDGPDGFPDLGARAHQAKMKWPPGQTLHLQEFLDQRGGDYDDCHSYDSLIERAIELEINTGPAKPPPSMLAALAASKAADAPAPPAAPQAPAAAAAAAGEEEEEYDPLDAFMDTLDTKAAPAPAAAQAGKKGARQDL